MLGNLAERERAGPVEKSRMLPWLLRWLLPWLPWLLHGGVSRGSSRSDWESGATFRRLNKGEVPAPRRNSTGGSAIAQVYYHA
jgi:hypothetical protein